MAKKTEFLDVKGAAAQRGLSKNRILQYIEDGRLPAMKIGNSYAIRQEDLDKLKILEPGRPKKGKG